MIALGVAAVAALAGELLGVQELAPPAPDAAGRAGRGRAVAIARGWLLAPAATGRAATLERLLQDARGAAASDDALALELVRRLPLPEEPSRVASLLRELGRAPLHDQLVLERIGSAPGAERDAALRAASAEARSGVLGPSVAVAAAFVRGATENAAGAADLFDDSLRPEPDVAAYSRLAFDRIVARELVRGRGGEVATLQADLAARHPELPQLQLDAGATLLLIGDFEGADVRFAAIAEAERSARSTAALERRGTAEIGRAWVALLRAAPQPPAAAVEAASAALARAVAWPRPLLAQEDPLRVLELRAAFVAAFGAALAGRPNGDDLVHAIERTPLDVERCFVDEAWFGPLGPAVLTGTLRGFGCCEPLITTLLDACAAIETTHHLHGHGLLAGRDDDEEADRERLASYVFLGAAERLLADRGDPVAALAFLAPRFPRLERLHFWANQELLVQARLLEARCRLRAGEADAAATAIDAALAIATSLRAGAGREFVRRVVHDEAPPPPAARLVFRVEAPYAALESAARVARANLAATLRGDADAAAEELFEAGATWPFDEERWLKCALDLARRGRGDDARRCLACVEASPDHAYDRACVFAWLGERDPALALLREHLEWSARTPAGRALELVTMARDRDLAALRDDPAFPRE